MYTKLEAYCFKRAACVRYGTKIHNRQDVACWGPAAYHTSRACAADSTPTSRRPSTKTPRLMSCRTSARGEVKRCDMIDAFLRTFCACSAPDKKASLLQPRKHCRERKDMER